MKFNCDSCGQRYAISDEKARGKVLKIRCRKCSEVIVVRGEPAAPAKPEAKAPAKPQAKAPAKPRTRASRESPALDLEPPEEADRTRMMSASSLQDALAASRADDDEGPAEREEKTTMMPLADLERAREAAAVGDSEGAGDDEDDDGWYAVVAGRQQGPLDDAAFDAQVASGRITERTYVWREGMGDWQPAKNVPVLAARLAAAGAGDDDHPLDTLAESVGQAAPPVGADGDDVAGDDPDDGGDAPVPAASADALDALFADIPEAAPGAAGDDNALEDALHDDPFASVPDAPGRIDGAPGEDTQMFILASGVNKRKSPVRIAAFVLGLVGVLGAMGFLVLHVGGIKLSSVLPMVHHHAAGGSAGPTDAATAARLRAQLMGGGDAQAKKAPIVADKAGDPGAGAVVQKEKPKVANLDPTQKAALAALYGDNSRGALAIKVKDVSAKGPKVDSDKSPIDPKIIAEKIGASQRAFQGCVQQELRRNPKFKGGRLTLTLTVAPSGVVTHAKLDRRDLADTDVGHCITGASRRIVFPNFAGDDPVDFEIPLVLSTGY